MISLLYNRCKGVKSNVNPANNLQVIYHQDTVSYLQDSTDLTTTNHVVKTNTNATTYLGLVSAVGTETLFFNTFKTAYNKNTTNVYLYNGIYTGETESAQFNYDDKQWRKLDGDNILVDEHFNTITLGLIMNNGVEQYCYGTMTIYVQPTNPVTATGVTYELPNGNFKASVNADALNIGSPFGSDWTATIVSVNGDESVENHINIVYNDPVDNANLVLDDRVPKDTTIVVKYTWNATIVFVHGC